MANYTITLTQLQVDAIDYDVLGTVQEFVQRVAASAADEIIQRLQEERRREIQREATVNNPDLTAAAVVAYYRAQQP